MNKNSLKTPIRPIEYFSTYPQGSTPVSYDKNNKLMSKFDDDVWDFTYYAYSPLFGNNLDFKKKFEWCSESELQKELIYEYKLIIFGLIYCNTNTAKGFSIQTIISCYSRLLLQFFKFAYECDTTLKDLSKNINLVNKITNHFSFLSKKVYSSSFHLLSKISSLSTIYKDHNFSLTNNQFQKIKKIKQNLTNKHVKQHLVIPTSLYLTLIEFITKEIDDFHSNQAALIELYKLHRAAHNKYFNFKKNIDYLGLDIYLNEKNIDSRVKFKSLLLSIVNICLTQIIFYSGMRHSEALLLPFSCFKELEINKRKVFILNGYTTKRHKGLIKTSWITSEKIKNAIHILQSLTIEYLKIQGFNTQSLNLNELPLSSFRGKNPIKIMSRIPYEYDTSCQIGILNSLNNLNFKYAITSQDLDELALTSPFDDIQYYNVKLGKQFPFTPHQFRRTLCVYAARSGFIKLPALKAQLQHIKQDMTEYYCNSAGNSTNLFDIDLINDFKNELTLDQFSNFMNEVVNSPSPLYGAEGTRLENAKNQKNIPLFLEDEDATLKALKDGKLSYKRTPLGGCSRLERCDEITELSITPCLTCKDAIFSERTDIALDKALKNFEIQLQILEPESPFSIHLNAEINAIKAYIQKRKLLKEQSNGI